MSGPININTAPLEQLKTIPNIGEKRAQALITLREERGTLSVEDVKMMSAIPNTIWDPLLNDGKITFETELAEPEESQIDELKHEIREYRRLYRAEQEQNKKLSIRLEEVEKGCDQKIKEFESTCKDQIREAQIDFEFKLERERSLRTAPRERVLFEREEGKGDKDFSFVDQLAPQGIYARKFKNEHDDRTEVSQSRKNEERGVCQRKYEGPSPPKMSTFDGKSDWRPFYTQF
ncbi:hypothetical protein FSP39_011387 [Pinctada imbricata]|uniref:Uncharacterized protein n=1 Tax=Pinctada imbricata TaxID=66713 RepID=A0AA88YPK6_PINIB|nr:hypothetical protein FSP39_011387 [Pinctada imbricata]